MKFRRSETAVSTNIDGEEILLDSEAGIYFALNEVASDVWQLLDQPITLIEIVAFICDAYDVSESECKEAIENLLAELGRHKLIVEEFPA